MKMEIIAALIHKPQIILLDEPTLGLDVISQSKIREFVKYYNEKYKTTFVITSHYTKDIEEMCKRVFVLNKGKSVYDGDFKTLINNINPNRKLIFEFIEKPDEDILNDLKIDFDFDISKKVLTATLPEGKLQKLLKKLLNNYTASNVSFEDLPVDDSMRSFFNNPDQYV